MAAFKSLFHFVGSYFFQYNILTGILIATGILYYSRIAFTLSLLGFFAAYAFYAIIGANLNDLNYSYIGFNYILTSVAIGGFFLIPSKGSYLSVLLLIPMLALLTTGLSRILMVFNLPVYSIPFNITVLMFLYVLKFRTTSRANLSEVAVQQNSPEKNLYAFQNHVLRFGSSFKMPFCLPFYGEWEVTQGHNGEHTHKENWRHAWDFEITDDEGKTYQGKGDYPDDYYCFAKPVLAAADGEIIDVVDDIEDNVIGKYNLIQNWGNTIIIKHTDYLYSKISHLKKSSAKVKKGDIVKTGQHLAQCGNSGRSPYPHLHFQFQTTPWIGSGTYEYPFRHLLIQKENKHQYMSFYIPKKNQKVCNIEVNSLLKNAFQLIPGQQIKISGKWNDKGFESNWFVGTNMYNKSYIYCTKSKSFAWFENDGIVWLFTHFEGAKNTLLYYFYLAAFKVQLGFYNASDTHDALPVNQLFSKKQLLLQDFVAPFFMYLSAHHRLKYTFMDDEMSPSEIFLESEIESFVWKKRSQKIHFEIKVNNNGISKLNIDGPSIKIESIWESL
jgi:murein DD-endopeptidase MepM/ murein hydrolase activator NlpD